MTQFEILGSIAIIYFPGCDVINFEINLIFLIKSLFYMTTKSRQKFKYFENEKSFKDKIKSIFKGLSVAKNCLRPESGLLGNIPVRKNGFKYCIDVNLFVMTQKIVK